MSETLKQVAERMAMDLAGTLHNAPVEDWPAHTRDALDAAMRAALAEPTEAMVNAAGYVTYSKQCWRDMAAERLKEL